MLCQSRPKYRSYCGKQLCILFPSWCHLSTVFHNLPFLAHSMHDKQKHCCLNQYLSATAGVLLVLWQLPWCVVGMWWFLPWMHSRKAVADTDLAKMSCGQSSLCQLLQHTLALAVHCRECWIAVVLHGCGPAIALQLDLLQDGVSRSWFQWELVRCTFYLKIRQLT